MRARGATDTLPAIDPGLPQSVLDRGPTGVGLLSPAEDSLDFVFAYANPALDALVPGGSVVGERFSAVFPQLAAECLPEMRRVLDAGGSSSHHAQRLDSGESPDGAVYVDCELSLLDGEQPRILALLSDVTARIEVEAALRRAEKDARDLVRLAPTAIYEIDFGGRRLLSVNDAMCTIMGYDREELLTKQPLDLLDEDSGRRFLERVAMTVQDGSAPEEVEYVAVRKDGTRIDVVLTTNFHLDELGRPDTALVVGYDVTERKRHEEMLRESRAKLASALAAMSDAVMISDIGGEFVDFNDAFVSYHGFAGRQEAADILERGGELVEIFRPDGRRVPPDMAPAARGLRGESGDGAEYHLRRPDTGREWDGSYSYGPIRGEGGEVIGAVVVARDVTERKRMEYELRRARRRAQADLDGMRRLYELGRLFVKEGEIEPVLEQVMDLGLSLAGAQMGNLQLVDPETSRLHFVVQRGFSDDFLAYWSGDTRAEGACGTSVASGQRVIVEDVEASPLFSGSPALAVQLDAGVRAVVATPLMGRAGALIGVLSVHYSRPHRPTERELRFLDLLVRQAADIIERWRAQEDLREAEAKASDLIEYAPTGIYEIDFRGPSFLTVNDAMCELSGYSREELLAMSPFEMLDEESRALFQERIAKTLRGEQPAEDVEYRCLKKGGEEMYVVLKVRFVRDEHGRPSGAFVIGHDVTERRQAEKRQEELLERLSDELDRTKLLQGVAMAASSGLDLDGLARRMLHELVEHMALRAGDVRVIAPQGRAKMIASVGYPETVARRFSDVTLDSKGSVALRAIREGRALTHEDAGLTPDRYRVLDEAGLMDCRMISLPLRFAGEPLGALSLVFDDRRPFTLQELDLFAAVASVASQAIANARAYATERDVADRLQSSMLDLPEHVEGIRFAHSYHSASDSVRVGGDFYDVFELSQSHVGIVIGDVAGKGLDAAMMTSLVKNTVRALATERGKSPAEVLALANDVVCRSSPSEAFVTLFFGLLDMRDGRLVYSNAGHTTAAVVGDDGRVHRLGSTGPLVGAYEEARFGLAEVVLGPAQPLFLYTDGLTEAFRGDEMYGEERLFDLLSEIAGADVDDIIEQVLAEVILFTGGSLRDDLAMLAVKRVESEPEGPFQQKLEM